MDSGSGLFVRRSPISYTAQFGYSIGHVLNDLCSACWFTYLIVFLTDIQQKSSDFAGVLMLAGQIADGLATPLVGICIDKINSAYGKRKTWHLIGTVCVAVSFAFVFHKCFGCEHSSTFVQQMYYGAFIILFQFGWASTQIAHLSLIPVLTVCKRKIVFLNAVRSGLTFVCGILVYVIMWFLLHAEGSDSNTLGPHDAPAFENLSYMVIGIGLSCSLVFHLLVSETSDEELEAQVEEQRLLKEEKPRQKRKITDWFKQKKFYVVGMMYMFTRLTVNVPQVYLPKYLTRALSMKKESIAFFPLMMLICSVIGSFMSRFIVRYIGKRATYLIGAALAIGSSFWFQFQPLSNLCLTYGATALMGAGSSIMLVLSLSMTADLIGIHSETGAFVYGAMSLLDKITNGIVIALIQHFHPNEDCADVSICPLAKYYRYVMFLVPGVSAVCGILAVLLLVFFSNLNKRQNDRSKEAIDALHTQSVGSTGGGSSGYGIIADSDHGSTSSIVST